MLYRYITSEIIELAGGEAELEKKSRIKPRHIMLAIKKDPELSKVFDHGDFCESGVVPYVSSDLM